MTNRLFCSQETCFLAEERYFDLVTSEHRFIAPVQLRIYRSLHRVDHTCDKKGKYPTISVSSSAEENAHLKTLITCCSADHLRH